MTPEFLPDRHHMGLPLLRGAGKPVMADYYFPSGFCCRNFFAYSSAC